MELPRLTVLNERFAIRSVLGELGPFEAAYLAWDLENEEQVVVREYLPTGLVKRDARGIGIIPKAPEVVELFQYGLERIVKEAELFSNINHPNVVKQRDAFRENGTIYRVFDYHAGASLAYVLEQQGGKISPKTAVTILMPLMDGIRAGHTQGLIHGAISPEKIYLTKTGRPMLLSFKTTHLLLAQKTQNLEAFQQPGFSPPEQYTPRGKHGPWSDVYGSGATLYTMLSGKQLPDIPARLREDIVPAFIDQSFELSLGTRTALKSALDMNIARRPQTIENFRSLLVDGFDLPGAHVPAPDAPEAKEAFRPRTKVTAPETEVENHSFSSPATTGAAAAGPVHFSTQEIPVPQPVAKKPLAVEEMPFEGFDAGGNGSYSDPVVDKPLHDSAGGDAGLTDNGFVDNGFSASIFNNGGQAASFQPALTDLAPVSPTSPAATEQRPAVFDSSPSYEERSWEAERSYSPRRNAQIQRGNRKVIFICLAIGGLIALGYLGYDFMQNREAPTFEISNSGYSAALLKGDSLYTLAEVFFSTNNWERAKPLFENAKENYQVALTLSDGDNKTLRQRIDSVDAYLNVPIEVKLGEKESLAHISRGDSVMRHADALNIEGDSVEARSLYMQAREEYLKVLDVRPDDSLANARFRQATQRMVAPVRVPPPTTRVAQPIQTEAQRLQQLYMQFKVQGDSAYDIGNLPLAREKFQESLRYKVNDEYASRRILIIDQRLADSERRGRFRQFMNSGRRLQTAGRLDEAKREFEAASQILENNDDALNAIFEINTLLEQRNKKEADFLSHKTRGEVLLEKDDYEGALNSFQAALLAKPDDEYVSQKVLEIRQSIQSLAKQEKELPEGMIDDNGIYNFTEEPPVLVGGREVLQSRLRYPPKAVEAGIEGRVSVRMIVDETGRMLNPQIQKGIRFDLDAEVMRVIRGARFEPGRVGGQPVKSWYTLFFEFKLDTE